MLNGYARSYLMLARPLRAAKTERREQSFLEWNEPVKKLITSKFASNDPVVHVIKSKDPVVAGSHLRTVEGIQ